MDHRLQASIHHVDDQEVRVPSPDTVPPPAPSSPLPPPPAPSPPRALPRRLNRRTQPPDRLGNFAKATVAPEGAIEDEVTPKNGSKYYAHLIARNGWLQRKRNSARWLV